MWLWIMKKLLQIIRIEQYDRALAAMLEGEYYFAEGATPGVPQVSATAAGRDMFNE